MVRKKTKKKNNNSCCFYSCKNKENVSKCKFCEEYFCKEHKNPKIPMAPEFDTKDSKSLLIYQKNKGINGHPCAPYYDYYVKNNKEVDEKYRRGLEMLLEKPIEKDDVKKYNGRVDPHPYYKYRNKYRQFFYELNDKLRNIDILEQLDKIIILIFVISILYYLIQIIFFM